MCQHWRLASKRGSKALESSNRKHWKATVGVVGGKGWPLDKQRLQEINDSVGWSWRVSGVSRSGVSHKSRSTLGPALTCTVPYSVKLEESLRSAQNAQTLKGGLLASPGHGKPGRGRAWAAIAHERMPMMRCKGTKSTDGVTAVLRIQVRLCIPKWPAK